MRWKRFNIESFVLPADVTREPRLIKQLCDQGVNATILVNDPCLKGCPITNYHFINSALHSNDSSAEGYSNYCIFYCKKLMLQNPCEILHSSFVRPEDIKKYLNLGVKYFKLVDRNKPSLWINKVFNAYSNESYSGNLLDLFPLFYEDENSGISAKLFIDNRKLDRIFEMENDNCIIENCQTSCFICNPIIEYDL
jgi:collagenase-like PrtC family protease